MYAYYYSFNPTGTAEVDAILSAVACAGKSHHHTEGWSDDDKWSRWGEGRSSVDVIQAAANEAASELAALREQRERGPRVACICGSTKQRAEHEEIAHALTMAGRIVLMCGVWGGPLTEAEKDALDVLHMRKIDAADEVWFVEKPDGTLGESTSREHAYATATGKPCLMVPAGESANIRRALGVTEEAETDE